MTKDINIMKNYKNIFNTNNTFRIVNEFENEEYVYYINKFSQGIVNRQQYSRTLKKIGKQKRRAHEQVISQYKDSLLPQLQDELKLYRKNRFNAVLNSVSTDWWDECIEETEAQIDKLCRLSFFNTDIQNGRLVIY